MATDSDTARAQYENYRWAYDNGHSEWLDSASTCFRYWKGEQWDKLVKAQLAREGRPAMTFNITESLIRAMVGMQRALRNDARFTPTADASLESARVMDAVWLHIQQQNRFEFLETDVYKKGLIMDRAYYEVKLDFSESLTGEVKITTPRSQDVVLDPSVEEYETDSWPQIIKRRWVSYNDVLDMYGKDKAEAVGLNPLPSWVDYEDQFLAQQMGALPYYRYSELSDERAVRAHILLERQYRVSKMKDFFVDLATGDMSEIPESWDDERVANVLATVEGLGTVRRRASTIRWDVTCDGELMHSADSPYRRFTIIPYFPSWLDGVAIGAVRSLLDPQDLYNKMTSQELHIINTTANSGLIVKRNSVKNMTVAEMEEWGSRSGIVFEADNVDDVKKITPNQTPPGHDRLSFKADQIMRNISGVSNQSRGFAREDVAGEAILANQAASDINSAEWLGNLHRTKQMLAEAVLDMVQCHYTDTRVIQINRGSVYRPQMEEITLNQPTPEGEVLNDVTHGKYSTTLVPSPARTTMSEGDFKLLLQMREKIGIAIPDSLLIELSPASNKGQIIESLQGDSNERQRQAEQLAAQKQQIELAKAQAQSQKDSAAAVLNQARAEKAAVESQVDPDAAYERVEMARIENDRDIENRRLALEREKLESQQRDRSQQIALRLAEKDYDRDIAVAAARLKDRQRDMKPTQDKRT